MTLTASGTIGIFQPPSPSAKSTIGSGEITPWSTSSSWQIVMSNSSATSERAMCQPKRGVAGQRRERTGAEALVGDRIAVGDAECERRVGVQEELVHVVVVDHDQPVGPELLEPLRHLAERAEQRLPLVEPRDVVAGVVDVLHGRRVRRADPSDDPGHHLPPFRASASRSRAAACPSRPKLDHHVDRHPASPQPDPVAPPDQLAFVLPSARTAPSSASSSVENSVALVLVLQRVGGLVQPDAAALRSARRTGRGRAAGRAAAPRRAGRR